MNIYEFRIDPGKAPLRRRVLLALAAAPCASALWLVLHFAFPGSGQSSMNAAVEGAIFGLAITAVLTLNRTFWNQLVMSCTIRVDSDSIREFIELPGQKSARPRTVRRGEVRSIFRVKPRFGRPGGIGVSDKAGMRARLPGYVLLPDTLAEFDELRTLVESWRDPRATQ